MALRRLVILAFAVLAAGLLAAAASGRSEWTHWQGAYFTCWLPNGHWQVVETQNSLDVSSPTGLATVSFAYATNGPAPYSISGVRAYILSPAGGVTRVRILSHGAPYSLGNAGEAENFAFRATRLRDRALVQGRLKVEVFSDAYGANAFAAYEQAAPAAQWKTWSGTLATVQKHITFYGHTP